MIHSSALVDPAARLGEGVCVGPWCEIGASVEIGEHSSLAPHVVITGPTSIGAGNKVYSFNSIGADSQDKKYAGEETRLEIGNSNVIREFCTINRGTAQGGGVTRIGNDNWIMAYVHIAHDCQIGHGAVMANGTSLAGHVTVQERVTFGGFTLVHQFCRIGAHSFTAMGTVVRKDVPPYVMVAGNPARPRGLNVEGLRRHGFSPETVRRLRQAYRIVYRKGLPLDRAVTELEAIAQACPEVANLAAFIRDSPRGIVR